MCDLTVGKGICAISGCMCTSCRNKSENIYDSKVSVAKDRIVKRLLEATTEKEMSEVLIDEKSKLKLEVKNKVSIDCGNFRIYVTLGEIYKHKYRVYAVEPNDIIIPAVSLRRAYAKGGKHEVGKLVIDAVTYRHTSISKGSLSDEIMRSITNFSRVFVGYWR